MVARGVRKSIANAILSGIGLSSLEPESSSARPISRAERPISVMSSRSHMLDVPDDGLFADLPSSLANDRSSKCFAEPEPSKSRPATSKGHPERPTSSHTGVDSRPHTPAEVPAAQNLSQEDDGVEPLIIASARDIDDLVRDMIPAFEGRESEDNWMRRGKNVLLLRRLTRGNAPYAFPQTYIVAVKTLLDGIFKVANSLRTTLCTNGCLLIQDVARTCGPKLDSMVEIMMQNLIKLCSALKKIAAQNGNAALDAVIGNVTPTTRILQHVHLAAQEKNVQLRLFAAGWLRTLIQRGSRQKNTVEHGGGVELLEKSIKNGLADANPGVREAMRSTFWTFYGVWPDKANAYVIVSLSFLTVALTDSIQDTVHARRKIAESAGEGPGEPERRPEDFAIKGLGEWHVCRRWSLCSEGSYCRSKESSHAASSRIRSVDLQRKTLRSCPEAIDPNGAHRCPPFFLVICSDAPCHETSSRRAESSCHCRPLRVPSTCVDGSAKQGDGLSPNSEVQGIDAFVEALECSTNPSSSRRGGQYYQGQA